jgi:hypothetical protein
MGISANICCGGVQAALNEDSNMKGPLSELGVPGDGI